MDEITVRVGTQIKRQQADDYAILITSYQMLRHPATRRPGRSVALDDRKEIRVKKRVARRSQSLPSLGGYGIGGRGRRDRE
jgi:hypothetical protein